MKLPLLSDVFYGNTTFQYIRAAVAFVVVIGAFELLRRFLVGRLKAVAEGSGMDTALAPVLDTIHGPAFYLLAFYVAVRPLVLPGWVLTVLRDLVIVAVTYRVVIIVERFVEYAVNHAVQGHEGVVSAADKNAQRNIAYLVDFLLWSFAVLFVLHNLGFHVESIITGLGITGVAVALGAQAVLGDLFAAIAILLDKPFLVGDAIALDNDWQGTVERIGLKTTRVRAPTGELLVFPNSVLTGSKLRNFRHLRERRVRFTFGVARETPQDKILAIKKAVAQLVSKAADVRLDRVNFVGIEQSSLDFEIVYYVKDSDYNRSLEINETMMLGVLDALRKEGVALAYPIVLQAPTSA